MKTIAQIFCVDLDKVPVVLTDRDITRKDQAKLTRELFKNLGIKGIGVTVPSYSGDITVRISLPMQAYSDLRSYRQNFEDFQIPTGAKMPDKVPGEIEISNRSKAMNKVEEILARAFPNHDQRGDHQSFYFDYRWNVS